MTPGRELDALIAEKVMGFAKNKDDKYGEVPWRNSGGEEVYAEHLSVPPYMKLPRYSTDIAAAWAVVEKLKAAGFIVGIDENAPPHSALSCCIVGKAEKNSVLIVAQGLGTTASYAICLAALKAVGIV